MTYYKRYIVEILSKAELRPSCWYYRENAHPREGQSKLDWDLNGGGRDFVGCRLTVNEHPNRYFSGSYYYQGSLYVNKVDCKIIEEVGEFDLLGREKQKK